MASKTRVTFVVLALFAVASWATAQTNDPLVGTWQLNAAKSKYSPGPGPKTATTTIAAEGSGYKFTVHQQPATGAAQDWTFTTNVDGKPVAITGNNPNADMIAYKRVNANTYQAIQTKAGKITQRQQVSISTDGNTRTVTTTGTDGAGQKINNVAVYDRK